MNKLSSVLAMMCLTLFATSAAAVTVAGNIYEVLDGANTPIGSTVDHWSFTVHSTGTVVIDTLSWEQDSDDLFDGDNDFDESVDVNADGEIAFIDSYIYLFNDDGVLDVSDYIADNDDSDFTYADGSIYEYDAYLSVNLNPGDYILAIGAFDLVQNEAISGFNPDDGYPHTIDALGDFVQNDHGDYQITFTGDVTVSAVPVPAAVWLFVSGLLGVFGYRKTHA